VSRPFIRWSGTGSNCQPSLFRGSITLRALTWKSSKCPAHAHPRWLPAVLRTFNTHNKCTGVCRFVRGISVGISRRVADCGVSVGLAGAPDLPGGPDPRHPGTATSACCDQSSSNPAWPGQPYPREMVPPLADSARLPGHLASRLGAHRSRDSGGLGPATASWS